MSKSKTDALMAFAKELEPGTTMIPCGCMLTRRLCFLHQFSISEIKNTRNSSSARAFNLYTPGHSWHNHHRRRHLLFLFGDYYEIGGLWVLERNIDDIKQGCLEREFYQKLDSPCCREMLCLNTGTSRPPNIQARSRAERNSRGVDGSTKQKL